MAKRRDYIPSKLDELLAFERHLYELVTKNARAWGIPTLVVKELKERRAAYLETHERSKDVFARSRMDVMQHDSMREDYTRFIRSIVQGHLVRNPKIDLVTKISAGWVTNSPKRRKLKKMNDCPFCLPESKSPGRVRFSCYSQNSVGRPKLHAECHAVEVEYMLLDVKQELIDVEFRPIDRKVSSKAQFTIAVGRSGQWLYCRARWLNTSDESLSSGWSEVRLVLVH
jgi:hypothetical protein